MNYLSWNDYEIIYLIKEGNEKALNLMYLKYKPFILTKARTCGFRHFEYDDCLQEGYILLDKALKTFDESYKKTFLKYFEIILLHRFWRLRNAQKIKYVCCDTIFNLQDNNSLKEVVTEYKNMFSGVTQIIFEEIFYYNTSVKELSLKLNMKIDKIYREVKKIREKISPIFDL